MTAEFILQLLVAFSGAAGVYAAIKADLTRAIILAEQATVSATEAHKRINQHIEGVAHHGN
jgi:hypothetical protein